MVLKTIWGLTGWGCPGLTLKSTDFPEGLLLPSARGSAVRAVLGGGDQPPGDLPAHPPLGAWSGGFRLGGWEHMQEPVVLVSRCVVGVPPSLPLQAPSPSREKPLGHAFLL